MAIFLGLENKSNVGEPSVELPYFETDEVHRAGDMNPADTRGWFPGNVKLRMARKTSRSTPPRNLQVPWRLRLPL